MVGDHEDGPAELDWAGLRARSSRSRRDTSEGGGERNTGLHHPCRHDIRRDVHGARARAPARRVADQAASRRKKVEAYREKTKKQDIITRKTSTEKTGVFTGSYAINPATGKEIPVWVSDYVLMEYGTGAIMGVPGHDERDFEFAKKFELPIVRVVCGEREDANTPLHEAFVECETGTLVNSGMFDGFRVEAAKKAIVEFLGQRRFGQAGRALPASRLVHLASALLGSADSDHLLRVVWNGAGAREGSAGAASVHRGLQARRLGGVAAGAPRGVVPRRRVRNAARHGRRETDVSDNFLDNSWYFLRYPSVGRDDVAFEKNITRKWLPVTSYIGGNEHAVLHLLYSRFITMVLHDAKTSSSRSRS